MGALRAPPGPASGCNHHLRNVLLTGNCRLLWYRLRVWIKSSVKIIMCFDLTVVVHFVFKHWISVTITCEYVPNTGQAIFASQRNFIAGKQHDNMVLIEYLQIPANVQANVYCDTEINVMSFRKIVFVTNIAHVSSSIHTYINIYIVCYISIHTYICSWTRIRIWTYA